MEYRRLGNSGAAVASLCLGTMTFGAEADEAASHAHPRRLRRGRRQLHRHGRRLQRRRLGGDHRPLARRRIPPRRGRWWWPPRPAFPMGPGPNDLGTSRRHLGAALDASLGRLGVERIDLYQMHAWDALTPIEETLRFLDDATRAGKIAYYGFSNFLGWQVTKAVHVARALRLAPPVTLQPQYNLLVRDIEHEIVPACLDAGIGLLPWSPLGGGWLAGKYARDVPPDRRDPPRREPRARHGGLRGAQRQRPHLARHRRGGGGGRGARGQPGRGGARLGRGAAGGHLGDPRRAHHRAAGGEPQGRRSRARRDGDGDARRGERARVPASIPTARRRSPSATARSRADVETREERCLCPVASSGPLRQW